MSDTDRFITDITAIHPGMMMVATKTIMFKEGCQNGNVISQYKDRVPSEWINIGSTPILLVSIDLGTQQPISIAHAISDTPLVGLIFLFKSMLVSRVIHISSLKKWFQLI